MHTLKKLSLHERLLKALDQLGFSDATEVQAQVIPQALMGHDLMVSSSTGSGKTLAFLLPMLQTFISQAKPKSGTRGLILVPTRELAIQLQKQFETLAAFTFIKSGLIIGGELYRHQVATLRKNPEVLIATPGRLVEHIEKNNTDFSDLEFLVLDEADRMLDMGFAEQMDTIAKTCNENRQNLLFSATLNHHHFNKISRLFKNPQKIEVDSFQDGHKDIAQQIILADNDKHKEKLVIALIAQEQPEACLIFCNTRLQCQKLSNILTAQKIRSAYIHSEIRQSDRKQILNQLRDHKLQILVATDVAARGIDISHIELVVNFTVAQSGDDHVHRVGRTGRAGKAGNAVTLVSTSEWNLMSSIERYLKIRIPKRKIEGLVGHYKGPKKLKASGKAAGTKNKAKSKKSAEKRTNAKKSKKPENKIKSKGQDQQKPSTTRSTADDGFAPFKKKKSS